MDKSPVVAAQPVSLDSISAGFERQWQTLLRVAFEGDLTPGSATLEKLQDARRKLEALQTDYLDEAAVQAEARQSNRAEFADLRFFSLGMDCFSRTVCTRWGFKPSAAMGERSHPFDLAVHPLRSVVKLLETDFSGYLDPKLLKVHAPTQAARHTELAVAFNHEKGRAFITDDFALLIAKYRQRIENFAADASLPGHKIFICHQDKLTPPMVANFRRLQQVIRERFPQGSNQLICLLTPHPGEPIDIGSVRRMEASSIPVIRQEYPFKGYVWHRHWLRHEALGFERALMAQLAEVVRQLQQPVHRAA